MHADNEPFSIAHKLPMEVTQCTTLLHTHIHISIYLSITIVGNDAFPFSLQINKSNTLLALRVFSLFCLARSGCPEKEKQVTIASLTVNICMALHFLILILLIFLEVSPDMIDQESDNEISPNSVLFLPYFDSHFINHRWSSTRRRKKT